MVRLNLLIKTIVCYLALQFIIQPNLQAQHQHQQEGRPAAVEQNFASLEKNLFYSDSSTTCYISYRIPYSSLIFVRDGEKYSAGLTFSFDLKKENKIILRKSSAKNLSVDSYEQTKSESDFAEGLISFEIGEGDLTVFPFLSILNSDRNIRLDSISIEKKRFIKDDIGRPVIVKKSSGECEKQTKCSLVNFRNTIPFSPNNYGLMIPVLDTSIVELNIKVEQEHKEIIQKTIYSFTKDDFNLGECKNEIILYKIRENKKIKYFFVDDFSYKLKEGTAKIIISAKGAKAAEYEFIVLWKNKPKTLMNPEFAIKLLTIIESEKKIDTLLSTDKKDYFNVLNKYWEKKNPDKKTAFNEIEYEFYKRADYAMKNFSTVSNPVGAKSDRGKIYIRYGEPDEIIREYSDSNSVIEVWKYKQLKREFVFTDKTGLGNYSLD